jgi:hypothetical protein
MTNSQLQVALQWAEDEWNRPSRTDHYLMRVAAEVARTRAKNPERVTLDDMKLEWGVKGDDDWRADRDLAVMILGGRKVRRRTVKAPPPRPNLAPPKPYRKGDRGP